MKLDHVCFAVCSIDATAKVLEKYLEYQVRTTKVLNSRQQVVVQFFSKHGSLDIKLIEPENKSSPLINFLKKGEGLHHLGFKTMSVTAELEEMKEKGARITAKPQPGEAFDEELIAFAYLGGGVNIELIDTDKRRDELSENI